MKIFPLKPLLQQLSLDYTGSSNAPINNLRLSTSNSKSYKNGWDNAALKTSPRALSTA